MTIDSFNIKQFNQVKIHLHKLNQVGMFIYHSCKICNSPISLLIQRKEIVVCENCGLIFFGKSLDEQEVIKIYDELYNNKDAAYSTHVNQGRLIEKGIQPRISYSRKLVLKHVLGNKTQKVAEIGAGVGVIGKYVSDLGYDYSGFELDNTIAVGARKNNINIAAASFEKLKDHPNEYDIIFAFEVIEHIDDLKLCLQLVFKSLKEKGKFGFTVPNFNKRNNIKGDPEKLYQPNPPVHVNFFTTQNLPGILQLFGFKISLLKSQRFPPRNLFKVATYINIVKGLFGKFEGSTIMCVVYKD